MSITPKTHLKQAALQRIRILSRLLDNAIPIPGTGQHIGLDPLLGLLPGAGDIAGTVLSVYIVLEAARFGLPRETLMRMVSNLVIDSVVGALPVLGDLFDFAWKANSRNLSLLEAHLESPAPQRAADRTFIALVIGGLILIVIGVATVVVLLINLLLRLIQGAPA